MELWEMLERVEPLEEDEEADVRALARLTLYKLPREKLVEVFEIGKDWSMRQYLNGVNTRKRDKLIDVWARELFASWEAKASDGMRQNWTDKRWREDMYARAVRSVREVCSARFLTGRARAERARAVRAGEHVSMRALVPEVDYWNIVADTCNGTELAERLNALEVGVPFDDVFM